jgi:DNA-binding transcriptional regulator GbsR (MarR family)
MNRRLGTFVDGIGAAAATSGVLSTLQGRIFALLYLAPGPMALDDVASELSQSKSNVSINIRGLSEWHLVKRTHVAGSRRDHYEAATDLVRVMQEIIERRFRWNMRQVLGTIEDTKRAPGEQGDASDEFVRERLDTLAAFFVLMDATAGLLAPGQPFPLRAEKQPTTTRTARSGRRKTRRE